MSKNKYSCAIL
uniref:Uncharacterized protein n=1 Tax=Moniliophthora roreri TaxID=221103 RepID=A0A0W0F641_MONRR